MSNIPKVDILSELCKNICNTIKAADDKSMKEAGYMLDSIDCINIVRDVFNNTTVVVDQHKQKPECNDISLRDYFAEKAMQSLMNTSKGSPAIIASLAYDFSDAMLKARSY